MSVNPNIPPPNGFVFRDVDGTKFQATNWASLERMVVAYRKQTGGVVDDVMAEILRQVCETTPDYCKTPGEKQKGKIVGNEHKAKIVKFLAKVAAAKRDKHLRYVQDSEADARSKTCQGCPHRVHVDIGCQSCKNTVASMRKNCLGGKTSRAPALGLCKFSECDLSVAIHIVEQLENDGRLPNFCWRKQK